MTQTPFRRRLPDGVLDYLVQSKPGWWQDLLEARYLDDNNVKQPLFIAIRDGYFNAYVEGQSVLKVSVDARRSKTIRLNAKIHRKYVLGRDAGDGYFSFDGENVFDKSTREVIEHYKGAETLERWILAASNYSKGEKKGVAAIACNHRNIIDVEMALPANENPKNGKKVAPRMDIVALERVENSKIQIAFYEAKLFRNKALHSKSGKPEILEQLDQYRKYAMDPKRNGEIVEAYKSACQIYVAIDEMRGDTPDELVSAVAGNEELIIDTEPRVIVYDYKEKQVARASSWMLRDEPLIRTRVKLLMEPNAKQIRL